MNKKGVESLFQKKEKERKRLDKKTQQEKKVVFSVNRARGFI